MNDYPMLSKKDLRDIADLLEARPYARIVVANKELYLVSDDWEPQPGQGQTYGTVSKLSSNGEWTVLP